MLTQPSGLFGILKFCPNGVLATQIFTRARDWPRLLAHTSNWDRGAPKNFKGEHLKNSLKFSICVPITSRLLKVTLRNFTRRHGARHAWCGGYSFWKGCTQQNLGKQKCPKFGAISDNCRLWAQIGPNSGMDRHNENLISNLQPIPRWELKIWWTLVHKQKSYRRAYWPPNWTFVGRLYFGP